MERLRRIRTVGAIDCFIVPGNASFAAAHALLSLGHGLRDFAPVCATDTKSLGILGSFLAEAEKMLRSSDIDPAVLKGWAGDTSFAQVRRAEPFTSVPARFHDPRLAFLAE